MTPGYRPPPPEKVGRSDLVRIERSRRRTAVLAVVGSVLVFVLAVNAMTRFARSWHVVTVMALRAMGKEPAPAVPPRPPETPAPSPEPAQPADPAGAPVSPSPMPVWGEGDRSRFFWVEVEPSDPVPAQPAEPARAGGAARGSPGGASGLDMTAPGVPVARMSQLPVCPNAMEPQPGEAIESTSMETVGGLRLVGMCGKQYAYELVNRTGAVLNATFTDNQGQQWDVLVPPAGSVRIKSATALDPGLIGRPRGQHPAQPL